MQSRRRHASARAFLPILLLLAGGCASGGSKNQTQRVLTDDLGRDVTLNTPVQRIVTLAPNITEIVYAAGASDRLVGVTTADDYPPEVLELARVGALPVDFEAITRLSPDLVLATDQVNSPMDAETLQALGIPVYYFNFASLDDIFDAIARVGEMAGTAAQATEHAETLRAAISTLEALVDTTSVRPSVLFLISSEQLFSFGRGSYVQEIIRVAGGSSVTSEIDNPAPVLSEEFVIRSAPDVIVGAFGSKYDSSELIERHPAWTVLPAIRKGNVYGMNPDIILRPGPRVVEAAYRMALFLHPGLMSEDVPVAGAGDSDAS